jgi:hypothetical protein
VLPVSTGALPALPQATTPAWQVGDHVYSLALSADGGLTLVEASIMGTARPDRAGERID